VTAPGPPPIHHAAALLPRLAFELAIHALSPETETNSCAETASGEAGAMKPTKN
jgi:hypothetical protein